MITESFEESTLNKLIIKQHYINLINKVKDVNGAISVCNELKIDISDLLLEEPKSKHFIAIKELEIIVRALNEGWKPNPNDISESKYYNYFYMNNGTFSYYHTYYCSSCMDLRSAPFFKSRELAEYAAITFIDLYKEFYF